MKRISFFSWSLMLAVLVSGLVVTGCESDESKIEKSYRQWVYENIDDPSTLKEIVSIDIEDTISLYGEYNLVYTSFFEEREKFNNIANIINEYDWSNIDLERYYFDNDSLYNLKWLKKDYIKYEKECKSILFDNSENEKIAIKANEICENNKSDYLILYLIKARFLKDEKLELDTDFMYYYPQNEKTYGLDIYYVFADLKGTEESKDLSLYNSIHSLRSKLSDIRRNREEVERLIEKNR